MNVYLLVPKGTFARCIFESRESGNHWRFCRNRRKMSEFSYLQLNIDRRPEVGNDERLSNMQSGLLG